MSIENHACHSNAKEVTTSAGDLSRRNFFAGLAVVAGALGFISIANSAQAASKKYKVCATKDIKVGGGGIYKVSAAGGIQILITQPKAGVFRAFNPACTHQGFRLSGINGTNLMCPIHGAQFDTTTGNVTRGPARTSLQKYTLTVESNNLYVTI
jgi:nitrite reductase/ring-hydroxylating ferredoxin subunit